LACPRKHAAKIKASPESDDDKKKAWQVSVSQEASVKR